MITEKIIKYPLATEKSIKMMESENKLVFVVDSKAVKSEIKKAIEENFKCKVEKINTVNDMKARKKAFIRLSPDTPAIDIATQLGIM